MWLKDHLSSIVDPIFDNNNSLNSKLFSDWGVVVGEHLKNKISPLTLIFPGRAKNSGTLLIQVSNPSYGVEAQMMAPNIIEKINSYFGYKLVAKIKFSFVHL